MRYRLAEGWRCFLLSQQGENEFSVVVLRMRAAG